MKLFTGSINAFSSAWDAAHAFEPQASTSSTEAQDEHTAIEPTSKMIEVKEHPLSLDEENERTLPDIPSASNDTQPHILANH